MKVKPHHHSGNMKVLFFTPCWWGFFCPLLMGLRRRVQKFQTSAEEKHKGRKDADDNGEKPKEKKVCFLQVAARNRSRYDCFHLIYTPLQEEAKNNFSRPVHPMFMPFTHANPEIPPDSAFFLALIKFSTEIFCAGETKRCSICATFRRSYISVLHHMTHN